MNYYFDESGNWQEVEQENRNLVIGAIVAKNEESLVDLEDDINSFKFKHNLKYIHLNELDMLKREELYKIVGKYLENNTIKAMVYLIKPSLFYSQTQKEPEDIYISVASGLLANIAFGDRDIDVEYDMKFYYAYPSKILENLKEYRKDEFAQMASNFIFKEEKIKSQKKRIKKLLERDNLPLDVVKNVGKLYRYVWEEFRLRVEAGARMREKFRERSLLKLEQRAKKLGLLDDIKLKIEYKNKYNQSIGVYIIDILTNIVRFHGTNPKSDEVKKIYKFIKVKEIKDGEF